jgi:hypothetical protein
MIGDCLRSKYPYSFDSIGKPLDKAFNVIQLTEPHEAGEILNNYYLIANEGVLLDGIMEYKFKEGYFVKLIDIRYFDLFETDFNYDDRDDLKKYGVKMKTYENQIVKTNVYGYCGIDYPEGF